MSHVPPNPEAKGETFIVRAFDRVYTVKFHAGRPREVFVRSSASLRRRSTTRLIWSGYGMRGPAAGRAAQVISFAMDPEAAEKAGAAVEDDAGRAARIAQEQAEREAEQKARRDAQAITDAKLEKAAKLAAAAPALLAALRKIATLDKHSGASLRDRAASEIARAAIEAATGEAL